MRDATLHRIHSIPDNRGAEWILLAAGSWTAGRDVGEALAANLAPRSEAIPVEGNHGRWIVQCPDCNGGQLAAPDDHRFMCVECANIAIDGLWRPVVWPKDWRQIGALLDERTDRGMQNYDPGETLVELREQNAVLADSTVVDGIIVRGAGALPEYPDFTGHKHDYPTRVDAGEFYACADPVCGHPELGRDITALRKSKVLR